MANKEIRKQKEAIVEDIAQKLKSSKATVIFAQSGLTVANVTDLRVALLKEGIEMNVYKNTLSRLAVKKAGFDDLEKHLTGANAFLFGLEDEVSASRIISDFSKDFKDNITIKAGVVDGKAVELDTIQALASIPGREGLITQLAIGMLQPLKEVAIGLNMLEESHIQGGN